MSSIRLALLALLLAGPAAAQIPSPRNSTVPNCIVVCPAGDLPVSVTVRDINNVPLAGVVVDLRFCPCAAIHFCPSSPSDGYAVSGCDVTKPTGPTGNATFDLRAGGGCSTPVQVFANGVVLGATLLSQSPDQNGDLVVDGIDDALLTAKTGGADLTGDLDCSNSVTAADEAVLRAHLGHACANATPARAGSWGGLKAVYR